MLSFLFINKTLRLNNLKIRTAMNAIISVFVICFEAIIYSECASKLAFKAEDVSFLNQFEDQR